MFSLSSARLQPEASVNFTDLPIDRISQGDPAEFPAGSIVFTPFTWHEAEPLQVGIRVGSEADILTLTDWHGGRSKAGMIVTAREDRPVYGIKPDGALPRIFANPKAQGIGYREAGRIPGTIGLGVSGIFLMSKARVPGFEGAMNTYPIDPVTWMKTVIPNGGGPEFWITDWSIRFPLSEADAFVVAIDRVEGGVI